MKLTLSDPLFVAAQPLFDTIESHGYEAYFVGGCVRDSLLGKPIHDIDIATSARPEEIESIFPITIDVGKEHGTIIVVYQQESYEITTFRTESAYSDFRHPDKVDFVRDLKEDTLRRDFTINALALDRRGQVYDYHGGAEDLDQAIIRAVGRPMDRFQEDALRIVRAIRFASQLGFTIEAQTMHAIQEQVYLLPKIAIERIRIEFTKFFMGPYFIPNANLLIQTRIDQALPILHGLPVAEGLNYMTKHLGQEYEFSESLFWYLFVRGLGLSVQEAKTYLRNWSHSNQLIQEVVTFYHLHDFVERDAIGLWEVYRYPLSQIIQLQELLSKDTGSTYQLLDRLVIQDKGDILVDGKQMMAWLGLEKGNARLGKVIHQVEYLIVCGELENKIETIRHFVEAYYDQEEEG